MNITTEQAMAHLKEVISKEPDYAWAWHCNIAMSIFDEGVSHKISNLAAARFMKLCFDIDTLRIHPETIDY